MHINHNAFSNICSAVATPLVASSRAKMFCCSGLQDSLAASSMSKDDRSLSTICEGRAATFLQSFKVAQPECHYKLSGLAHCAASQNTAWPDVAQTRHLTGQHDSPGSEELDVWRGSYADIIPNPS